MTAQQLTSVEDVLVGIDQHLDLQDFSALHELVETGVPAASIRRLERFLGLNAKQTARLLGISDSTRKRLKARPRVSLSHDVSDRLVRVLQVFDEAVGVFGDTDKARRWFAEDSIALGDRPPIDLLSSAPGVQLILDELNTIRHGNWA